MHLCSPLLWQRRMACIVCCTFKSFAASPPDRMRILTPRLRSCTAPDRLHAAMLGDQRADGRRGRRSRKTLHSTRAELENVIYVECMAFTGLQLAQSTIPKSCVCRVCAFSIPVVSSCPLIERFMLTVLTYSHLSTA